MKRKGILIVLCVMVALFACGFVACKKKHTHSYVATVVEPTCSTQGYTEHVCSCGESYKDSFVEPSGHSEGEPVYIAGSVSSDQKSAVISEITSCKFCSVQLNKKDYNVSLPEETFSYDGKVHESKISGDKLPDDIMIIYSYVGLSAHSFADGVISAGDYDVAATFYKKSMPIEPLLSLISDLHIIKDGKYHEVTFCFDDLLTNNISIAVKHGETIAKSQMPEIPDKNGYSGKWVYSGEKITADISISVFYTPIEYKITYVLDGAANNPRNPKTYTYESGTLTLYAPESSAGYTFQGWYTSPEFESQSRISLIKSGSTGDLVLYAKFLKYRVEAADGFTFDYENYDYPALIQTVSSTRSSITLSTTIKVSDGCTWTLSRDIEGLNVIKTKNMSLVEGHNTAYVTVWYGEEYNVVYYLDVYRLGLRSYTFYVDDKVYRSTATVEEQSFISAPEAPEKTGYTFNGWYAYEIPEEESDAPVIGSTVTAFPYRLDHNVAFYALFTPNVYTASFDVNGGKPLDKETQNVTYDTLFVTAAAKRDGYTFVGWTDEFGVFVSSIVWKYARSMTFTAQWKLNVYTFTYVYNDGTGFEEAKEFTIEDDDFVLDIPTRTAYNFEGWYTEPELENLITVLPAHSFGDKTFYAKWSPVVYKINYELNGGNNNAENPESYTVESETITLADPSRTGYAFDGWYTEETFENKTTGIESGSYGDETFYAKWTAVVYKINYELNGGSNNGENPANYTIESETITLVDPSRTGYVFDGWYTESTFENKTTGIESGSYGNKTFYAKWSPVVYKINYELNGGSNSSENPANYTIEFEKITLANPSKTGYNFSGWYTESTFKNKVTAIANGSYGDKTFYAKWTAVVYKINYELNGGSNNSKNPVNYTIESEKITLANPSRTGYNFSGWYTESTFKNKVTAIANGSYGDKTFYAKWTAIVYKISYTLNGGSNSSKNPANYTIESEKITLANPSKTGYIFDGWYTESAFENKITGIESGSYGNKTFYAKWVAVVYEINYELNGGSNNSKNPVNYTIESETITLANPSKTGYNFSGWYTESTFKNKVTAIASGSYGDKTFYAKWTAIVYKINYELNGGSNNDNNLASYTIESETITLANPSRTGYSFSGWYTESTFKNKVTAIANGSYGDKTFYAKWTAIVYKISYTLNGGSNSSKNPASYTIASGKIILANPSRTGYSFSGWYTESTFKNKVTAIASGSYGNKTFYAKWTAVVYKINYELNGGSNNSKNPASYTIASGKITLAEPSGTHPFTGWYKDIGLNQKITEIAAGSYGDITLYAGWQHGDSDEWIVDKEPTCTNTGLRHRFCAICGSDYYGSIPIDPNVHVKTKEVEENVVESTCRKAGSYDVVVYCTECNLELSRQSRALPLVDHLFDKNNVCTFCGLTATKGLAFTKIGSSYEVAGIGTCTETDIIIPKYYLNEQVTSIGEGAFYGCDSLTSIVIPSGVTSIGGRAFEDCRALTSIVIPSGVTRIGYGAFV